MTPNTDEKTFIIWDKKFEIGIPVIDEQHRQLVLLTNDFYKELMNYKKMELPKWEPQLIQALKKCTDYVLVHFNAEEKLMQYCNYEHFMEHKKAHNEFTEKVLETAKNFDNANFTTALNFVKFLYQWILEHIGYEDKKYVPVLKEYLESTK